MLDTKCTVSSRDRSGSVEGILDTKGLVGDTSDRTSSRRAGNGSNGLSSAWGYSDEVTRTGGRTSRSESVGDKVDDIHGWEDGEKTPWDSDYGSQSYSSMRHFATHTAYMDLIKTLTVKMLTIIPRTKLILSPHKKIWNDWTIMLIPFIFAQRQMSNCFSCSTFKWSKDFTYFSIIFCIGNSVMLISVFSLLFLIKYWMWMISLKYVMLL